MRLRLFPAFAAAFALLAGAPHASATELDGNPIKLSTTEGVY